MIVREIHTDNWSVRLDLSRQRLGLEVPEYVIDESRDRRKGGDPLLPTLPDSPAHRISAAMLMLKAKQFDDRLMAAVELAAQRGVGRFAGKAGLLPALAATLDASASADDRLAAVIIHAACELGGLTAPCPEALAEAVRKKATEFLADPFRSKPLGIYTRTEKLSAIFRQDRFLQTPLDPGPADALTRALERGADLADAYAACLRLDARITNPPKKLGVLNIGKRPGFFPASRSHEVELLESLSETTPIPEGFDLMGELIRRIRSGALDLKPTEQSGWYDYQTWSLESLVVPERTPENAHLEWGKRYRKHLEDLFRATLALMRETQVKRSAAGYGGGRAGPTHPPIIVAPDLSLEPLPTLYARRADGYRFVRTVLEEAFGPEVLRAGPLACQCQSKLWDQEAFAPLRAMHRLTREGTSTVGLLDELDFMEKLFDGAAAVASRDIGLEPPPNADAAVRCFMAWRMGLGTDPDVSADARMMVPVFYDFERQMMKVWAFLGWRSTPVDADYRTPPEVLSVKPRTDWSVGGEPPRVEFTSESYEFAASVMVEVYVKQLLDRDEFRRHCDRFQTKDAIVAHLT